MRYLKDVSSTFTTHDALKGGLGSYHTTWIGWSPSEQGWITLNTDDNYKEEVSMAGEGSLLRDQDDRWITGFSLKLGTCTALVAELWARSKEAYSGDRFSSSP